MLKNTVTIFETKYNIDILGKLPILITVIGNKTIKYTMAYKVHTKFPQE